LFVPVTTNVSEPRSTFPLANWGLIAATCLVSALSFSSLRSTIAGFGEGGSLEWLVLHRGHQDTAQGLAQLVGHTLLHADVWHLVGNMVLLFAFGNAVNRRLGNARYLGLYLVCAVAGALAWQAMGSSLFAIGASGAVLGVAGAFAVLFPRNQVRSFTWVPGLLLGGQALVWHYAKISPDASYLFVAGALVMGHVLVTVASFARYGSSPDEGYLLAFLGFRLVPLSGLVVVGLMVGLDVVALVNLKPDGVAHWAHVGGALSGLSVAGVLALTGAVRGLPGQPTLPEWTGLRAAPPPAPRSATLPFQRRAARKAELSYSQWAQQALQDRETRRRARAQPALRPS
jgi:rhomboid family protein